MSAGLEKYEAPPSALELRRADARDDQFVREYMAQGEALLVATRYTQSTIFAGLQFAVVASIVGYALAMAAGSTLGALAAAGAAAVMVGLALALETSGRLVITDRALVVQSSVLLERYERAHIHEARVASLGPRDWLRVELRVFDPRDCLRTTEGLRFRYAPPKGRIREVFIAAADARELLELLGSGPQAALAARPRGDAPRG